MPEKIIATWYVSLDVDCPYCSEDINILNLPEIHEIADFDLGESGTKRSTNIEVVCPHCNKEFLVDLEY